LEKSVWSFDLPGTTRDAISVPFEHMPAVRVSTLQGFAAKQRLRAIEKFSLSRRCRRLKRNVVLLLLDATQGVRIRLPAIFLKVVRRVVLAVNKWDAVDAYQRELLQRSIETRLGILKFASIHHISAIKRQG
jgi:GTP-binding protein